MEPNTTNKELLELLREGRSATHAEYVELDRKFDGIQAQFDAFRKEQRAESDATRREMLSYFVAKTEFSPHRDYVMAKFAEYDRIVAEGRQQTPEWVRVQEDIKALKGWIEEIKKHRSATWPNIMTVILFIVAVLSFVIQSLPHISVHP